MERLTFDGLFCDIVKCDSTPGGTFCESGTCTQRRVWERLKEYENTGLEPEDIELIVDAYGRGHTLRTESAERLEIVREIKADRLREIVQAEKDGRLVVLPCKVGDTVYAKNHHGRIVYGNVESIHQNCVAGKAGRWVVTVFYPEYNGTAKSGLYPDLLPHTMFYGLEDFGKTVFRPVRRRRRR